MYVSQPPPQSQYDVCLTAPLPPSMMYVSQNSQYDVCLTAPPPPSQYDVYLTAPPPSQHDVCV